MFDTEDAAWDYVLKHYTPEKNYVMRNAKKAGKKVAVGVKKKGRKYVIYIAVG